MKTFFSDLDTRGAALRDKLSRKLYRAPENSAFGLLQKHKAFSLLFSFSHLPKLMLCWTILVFGRGQGTARRQDVLSQSQEEVLVFCEINKRL